MYHYEQSGPHADSEDVAQVQALQKHLNRCIQARKLKEWNTLVKETDCAISSGADSSPEVSYFSKFFIPVLFVVT